MKPVLILTLAAILLATVVNSLFADTIYLPALSRAASDIIAPTATPTPTSTSTATPSPTPTTTPTLTPTATATTVAAVCSCEADTLNCSDFATHNDAQACYDYCIATVGFDVHRLDQNNDGNACESLP